MTESGRGLGSQCDLPTRVTMFLTWRKAVVNLRCQLSVVIGTASGFRSHALYC
jgi:hypothetical protein